MSFCHKHQQEKYHNENTKVCMFIHCMYVDILFLLTGAIPVMFEVVTKHYQTLQIWIDHNPTRYHNFNALPHALLYIFSLFSLVWSQFVTNCTRYRQFCLKKYQYKCDSNAW